MSKCNVTKASCVPCVDWFRGIVPVTDIKLFLEQLGRIDKRLEPDNWIKTERTMLNYSCRWVHYEKESLTFAYNPIPEEDRFSAFGDYACKPDQSNNPFVLVSLSGDALRYLGADTVRALFQFFAGLELDGIGTKCTRIDLAMDFYDENNNIVPLMQDCFAHFMSPVKGEPCVIANLVRRPTNWQCYLNRYPDKDLTTYNYTIGNHGSSHGMFRLYDKLYETMYGRNARFADEMIGDREYWFRGELELHNCRERQWANEAFYSVCNNDDLYAIYGKCLSDFFRLSEKCKTEVRFSDISVIWSDFLAFLASDIHFV